MVTKTLRVDAERLWASIEETAAMGATPRGGLHRLTLSDEDRQVRDWLVARCEEAGCAVFIDALGDIFAERAGSSTGRRAVACGSHLDTQPAGGKFDGVLGVLAALEVIRTLNDAGAETEAPICLVNWTNEEGSRFAPAMLASGVYAGEIELDWALGRRDSEGTTFADALSSIGYRGPEPVGMRKFDAFLELHIEQGLVLERIGTTIGVVEGAQGMIWYDAEVVGHSNHAGTTPMALRRDALAAFSELCLCVETIARTCEGAVGTVGYVHCEPGSRNTVPGRVRFSIEFRHPDMAAIEALNQALLADVARVSAKRGVALTVKEIWRKAPVHFDGRCVSALETAARNLGYSHRRMTSGAGHDACNVGLAAPAAMIFVPCRDGISHDESEYASPEACAAGANVLLQAVLELAHGP